MNISDEYKLNYCLEWPDFFAACQLDIQDEAIFCIQWPNFFLKSDVNDKKCDHLLIWPNYFEDDSARCRDGKSFFITWPNYFESVEILDRHSIEHCIQWPEFVSSDVKELLESSPQNIDKIEGVGTHSTIYESTLVRNDYDHSDNLSGLQHVSGHYRRLPDGTRTFVRPHRRNR